ncbi:hypothetical protein RN001_014165 [Aquatica leii]|uniref:Kynurenine formamidase n=1 Tax=Aquatica leii TaxID=1421715 RepID=A0AAN7Q0I5_9COLE|nr:hypothetical protein RN001_014165 [Aquatica leii]
MFESRSLILFLVLSVTADLQKEFDLTWPFNHKTPSWAGSQQFTFTKIKAEYNSKGQWYAANEFAVAEHAGTHLDAPYHFDADGWKVGDIPLENLHGNGIKIDLSNETKIHGNAATLLPKHLIEWEEKHGPIPQNSIVLVYFNWGKYYHDKAKYFGGDSLEHYKFPGISAEAAQWIVDTGKVLGVGIDTGSVDLGNTTDYPVHIILLKNKIYNLENVNIPESLPEKGYWITVMPMYIAEGTGAPVRIVAYLQKPHYFSF